jgi:eukaryotic-like serine/threonine-protein kinase
MDLSIPRIAALSRLLDEALTLDPARRLVWLENLSPEYQDLEPALRRALLPEDADGSGSKALATLPAFPSTDEASGLAASGLQPGARVGPYELVRPLGAGGMAEVWLARRADGAFKREVALKLPTLPTLPMLRQLRGDLEKRFARERDILASLEHPQIARFYDAGVDPNGLPYVAMEYVQGEPLTKWCDARRLPLSARLELFVQVLAAVEYAHQNHVVHRDLKPSNILVTGSGQVRLLDFGVATLLEAQEEEHAPMTRVYARAVTTDYASPELLRGDPIDPRSDVYSLGVVLYELLTCVRPYRLKGAALLGSVEQAIDSAQVRKPSTQIGAEAIAGYDAAPEKLARQLRGDLDAIALKALAKQPNERYPSPAALAEDLRCYLEGKPLLHARPTRLPDRLGKFVRRNRAMVGISATAAAAILAAIGYAHYREDEYRLNQEKVMANLATVLPPATPDKSIAVLPFVNMSSDKEQDYFSDGLSEELIDLLTKVPGMRVPARTSSFYFRGRQATVAEIAKALNVAHVLEGSVRKAGDTIRVTAQLIRADNGYHLWSETYDRKVDDIFKTQDDIAGAVVEALKISLKTGGVAAIPTTNGEAYLLYMKGRYLRELGSAAHVRAAVDSLNHAVALDSSYAPAWSELADCYIDLSGGIDEDPVEINQHMALGRSAIKRAIALNPGDAHAHYLLAIVLVFFDHNWSGALAEIDAAHRADPNLREPVDLVDVQGCLRPGACFEKFIRDISRDIERDPLNARALGNRGYGYYYAGDLQAAESDLRHSLVITPGYANSAYFLGRVLVAEHKFDEAMRVFESMPDSLYRREGLAIVYFYQGKKRQADAALAAMLARDADDAPHEISELYAVRGNATEAIKWSALDYDKRKYGILQMIRDPLLAALAQDPRYIALLHKIAPSEPSSSRSAQGPDGVPMSTPKP